MPDRGVSANVALRAPRAAIAHVATARSALRDPPPHGVRPERPTAERRSRPPAEPQPADRGGRARRPPATPRSSPASADSPAKTSRPRRVTRTDIAPARWCWERSTARRSSGSGTVSVCAAPGGGALDLHAVRAGAGPQPPGAVADLIDAGGRQRRIVPSSRTTAAVACSRAGPTPTGPPANATDTSSPKSCAWPHHQRSGKPPPQFFSAYAPAPSRLNASLPATTCPRTSAANRCGCQYWLRPGTACAPPSPPYARRGHVTGASSVASSRQSGPRSSRSSPGPAENAAPARTA